ncbi:MAG: hypothetical protein AB1797_07110 [bacterium]
MASRIAKIKYADNLYMINLMGARFFAIPEDTPRDFQRFTITIKAHPNHFKEIYDKITRIEWTSEAGVVYVAYTFHLFGDSIVCSVLAKDEGCLGKFAREHIRHFPGVIGTQICFIKKTHRLVSLSEWKEYAQDHWVPKGWEEKPVIDVSEEPPAL